MKLENPDGSIAHAEVRIGDSPIMIGEEMKEMGFVSPTTLGGTAASVMLYVDDADALFQQAVDAGGTVERPVSDQFYGDRNGMLADPFGHRWTISTHVEDISEEQMGERFVEWMKQHGG